MEHFEKEVFQKAPKIPIFDIWPFLTNKKKNTSFSITSQPLLLNFL